MINQAIICPHEFDGPWDLENRSIMPSTSHGSPSGEGCGFGIDASVRIRIWPKMYVS